MKRDKDGYKDEFLQQHRNFLSELEIFKLKVRAVLGDAFCDDDKYTIARTPAAQARCSRRTDVTHEYYDDNYDGSSRYDINSQR